MKFVLPLRYTLPGVIFVMGASMVAVSHTQDIAQARRDAEGAIVKRDSIFGDHLIEGLEKDFAQSNDSRAVREFQRLSSIPQLSYALLCDDSDKIILSSNAEYKDRSLSAFRSCTALAAEARKSKTTQSAFSEDRNVYTSIVPFRMELQPGRTVPTGMGVLVLAWDILGQKVASENARVQHSLTNGGILLVGCFTAWLLLRTTITQRVHHLAAATMRFTEGDLTTRVDLKGLDELAELGKSFNRMAATIEADAAQLRANEKQILQDAKDKTELLREVNHRTKNNLSAILGLLQYEKNHTLPEHRHIAELLADQLSLRLKAFLQIHQLLSDSQWGPLPLDQIARHIVLTTVEARIRNSHFNLCIDMPAIAVSPRQASNVALVLNELATNSTKYAVKGEAPLQITVKAHEEPGHFIIEYRDNGPGYPDAVIEQAATNVGLDLVRSLMTGTLRGQASFSNDGGAVALLRIRAERHTQT